MIIPLTADQIRTFQDTGRVTVELPEPRQPEFSEHGYNSVWIWRHHEWHAPSRELGCPPSSVIEEAPYHPGDRVAIGEEWMILKYDSYRGLLIIYSDGESMRWAKPDGYVDIARNNRANFGTWFQADIMPEWAVRLHATVASTSFKRSGDVWVWAVELEAE